MPNLGFDPKTDVPDLDGKVILITGGTAGLGASAARTFAAHNPAQIFLSGRNKTAAAKLTASLSSTFPSTTFTFLQCDLTSLASVRTAAQTLLDVAPSLPNQQGPRIDIVLCNAGIMSVPPGLTQEGYEIQFGTNHVGHALLVDLLLPAQRRTAAATGQPARCVLLSSQGYLTHPSGGIQFDTLRTTQAYALGDFFGHASGLRYGQSKLANVLYAAELARHEEQRRGSGGGGEVVFASVHPGVIFTELVTGLPFSKRALVKVTTVGKVLTEEQGGWNSVWACTADVEGAPGKGGKAKGAAVKSGEMYFPVGKHHKPWRMGADRELATKLWEWTEKELAPWRK